MNAGKPSATILNLLERDQAGQALDPLVQRIARQLIEDGMELIDCCLRVYGESRAEEGTLCAKTWAIPTLLGIKRGGLNLIRNHQRPLRTQLVQSASAHA